MVHPLRAPQTILWISMDEDDQLHPLSKHSSTSIRYHPTTNKPCPPWFERRNITRIRNQLGNTPTHTYTSTKFRALHQSIVMAEILQHDSPYTIKYFGSTSAALTVLAQTPHTEKKPLIIWLDALQDIHPYEWMKAYDSLTNECGKIYPPRSEINWADFKIYDMQTFDRIALADDTAFRPLTCYPGGQPQCLLPPKKKSVAKRSHGCGCSCVKVISEKRRGRPECERRVGGVDRDEPRQGFYRWVHQEYIPSLVEFGEFRVFVATRSAAEGAREPYVLHVLRTTWFKPGNTEEKDPKELIGNRYWAVEVEPGECWGEYPELSYRGLESYALHVYRKLQLSGEVGFQSLNVGARLDIGISPDGKEFFMNEVTRWYGAHQFAMDYRADTPQDKVARGFAKAFGEVLDAEVYRDDTAGVLPVQAKRKAESSKEIALGGATKRVKRIVVELGSP